MKRHPPIAPESYRHLFGPVPSRRLGVSLGVDLLPHKTCPFDCVFCQLGPTRLKTRERREYVPSDVIIGEIGRWIDSGGHADYVTLSGSGEPTLHTGFGEIIRFSRSATSIPVALLTNGSLLRYPEVREAAACAHLVKVSLSAWDDDSFVRVNRPAPGIHFEDFLSGLKVFRRHYRGVFWVEVFLVPGLNSVPADVSRIARITETLKPDCVHLNTAVRPPVLNFVKPLTRNRLEALTGLFDPSARIAFGHCDRDVSHRGRFTDKSIVAMISRRPCTPGQIATAFGMHRIEVSKHLERLLRSGRISRQGSGNGVYFRADVETAKKEGGGISEG